MACCSLPAGGVTPSFTSHRGFVTCSRTQLPGRLQPRRHAANAVPGEAGGAEDYARREFILQAVNYAVLGDLIGTDDGRTIVNSILGAYGLPQLKTSKGFKFYDDFDSEYTFEYPTGWVSRPNSQRQGIYIADFNTADKLTVEVFDQGEAAGQPLQEAVVSKIVDPAKQAGGDSKLFFPSERAVKAEEKLVDGQKYLYLSFPSTTITRSGYEVRRKNFAVAATKNGQVFCLGASARSDQFNPEKENLLRDIVDSFRLR